MKIPNGPTDKMFGGREMTRQESNDPLHPRNNGSRLKTVWQHGYRQGYEAALVQMAKDRQEDPE